MMKFVDLCEKWPVDGSDESRWPTKMTIKRDKMIEEVLAGETKVCRIGCFTLMCGGQRLGPGGFSSKDPVSLVAASINRIIAWKLPAMAGNVDARAASRVRYADVSAFLANIVLKQTCSLLGDQDRLDHLDESEKVQLMVKHKGVAFWESLKQTREAIMEGWGKAKDYVCSIFMKDESNVKEQVLIKGRGIVTMGPGLYWDCAMMLKAMDTMLQTPFMSERTIAGKRPIDIALKLHEISSLQMGILGTDFVQYEGSQDAFIREHELWLITEVMRFLDVPNWNQVREVLRGTQTIRTQNFSYNTLARLSGFFNTYFGNTFVALCLSATAHYELWCVENDDESLENWYADWVRVPIIATGDDCNQPNVKFPRMGAQMAVEGAVVMNNIGVGITMDRGNSPADVDYLRRCWFFEGDQALILVNVFRVLRSMVYIKASSAPSVGRTMSLVRAAAFSAHHLSPGFPILNPLIRRLLYLTRGAKPIVESSEWQASWQVSAGPVPAGEFDPGFVDPRLAQLLADSTCPNIPAITVEVQEAFSAQFESLEWGGQIHLPEALLSYPEADEFLLPQLEEPSSLLGVLPPQDGLIGLMRHIGVPISGASDLRTEQFRMAFRDRIKLRRTGIPNSVSENVS